MGQPIKENSRSLPKRTGKRGSKTKDSYVPPVVVHQDQDSLPISVSTDLKTAVRFVSRLYKLSCFDAKLKAALVQLSDCCRNDSQASSSDYWKGRNLLYELNEIIDFNSQIPDQVFTDGYQVKQELRTLAIKHTGSGFMFSERRLLREKALFVACYAHEVQRRGEKHVALEQFEWLVNFVDRFVKTDEFPCFGTQAVFCYHMGSILRKLELHHRAEIMFSKALDLLHERTKHHDLKGPSPNDIEDQLFVVRKQAMIIGLGFGLLNMSRGSLERAEHAFTTARSLLGSSKDPLIPAYIELQCGVLKRCRAGTSWKKLKEAIAQLETARSALKNHARHRIRASWELALARTLSGDLPGAQRDLQQVEQFAIQKADQKWLTNVHILQSRMLRKEGKFKEALMEAELAVETANSHGRKTVVALVDALITRGEAQLNLTPGPVPDVSKCALAKSDFKHALQLISGEESVSKDREGFANPKIVAACKLRLAQTYAREGDESSAQTLYNEWLRLDSQVEHEWLRELAVLVRDEISRLSRNFSISALNSKEWDYSENLKRMRHWLAWRALSYSKQNYSEAARLMGITRATLYQWIAETSKDIKRRGRQPQGLVNGNGES